MKLRDALIYVGIALAPLAACGGGNGGDDDQPGDDDGQVVPDASPGTPDARPTSIDAAPAPDAAPQPASFTAHSIDADGDGPAYVAVGNLDGDAALEIVASHLGKSGLPPVGSVRVYERGADLDHWTSTTIDANVKFPGQPTLHDVDGDGDLDIILPSGFLVCGVFQQPCGALGWYEHTANGTWTRHDLITGSGLFFHHVELADIDNDGTLDLVTGAEQKAFGSGSDQAIVQWYKGTSTAARFETTARAIGNGGGSFPRVVDVDGDGDQDVASAEFFVAGGSFAWFERTANPSDGHPAGEWTKHVIADDVGPSIDLMPVQDLFGDGMLRYLGTNHSNTAKQPPDPWESAVYVMTPGADPTTPWTKSIISTGIVSRAGSGFAPQAAPGIFGVGDMDDDGDLDVVVSGDGDARVLWIEQTSAGHFATHTLGEPLGQAGGVTVVDLDGNGTSDTIVTAYEEDVVQVYTHD